MTNTPPAKGAKSSYPLLFSPLKLGNLTLPNRIVMAPMSTNLGTLDGAVTPEQIAFYRARATGGTGMIIVEFCSVQRRTGRSELRQLSMETEADIAGHQRLVEAITSEGAVACLQLQHGGPGISRSLVESGIAVGPCDVTSRRDPDKLTARALTNDEIEELIECFGRSAELALKAGYQAIELHGAHGYLLTSFLSPFTNHRDDHWGGDMDRRLNFPRRIIERVKQAIGDSPLSFRLSADEFTPDGNSAEDMRIIAKKLVSYGCDMLHVSIGLGATSFDKIIEPMSTPEGWRLPYAKAIKEIVDVPVISVGQIRWPQTAENAIADNSCDLIALGRPLLADPAWANKAKRGESIRPCTSCNYCITLSDSDFGHVGCAENPLTGRELMAPLDAGENRGKKVIVVGAGPGGMSAALLLQNAGFNTSIFESRPVLGGGLIVSAAPPFKDKLDWYRDYLIEQLDNSGVEIHADQSATVEQLKQQNPHIVVLANGGEVNQMNIKGVDNDVVCDAYELLMGQQVDIAPKDAGEIMVYGGGETGCECAEYLVERGYKVSLVSRSPAKKLARSAEMIYRGVLLQRLRNNPDITIIDNTAIEEIFANGDIQLRTSNDELSTRTVSRLYIAQGRHPALQLRSELMKAGIAFTSVGDAAQSGRIGDAVHQAYTMVQGVCSSASAIESLAC